uniref:Uncharacterized protein n=2 Tax=Medicago truncatula TaxID=3880 RepID=A2Q4F8_MEDTR|nr:hypothetical protein MtrDRAFT_AC157473g26v2 [Medicago truncatula]
MSDSNNNNNINTGASGGAGSSSRRTDNTKFPTMDKIFGIRPPPRERTGDANNNTKGTKFPTMQDVFAPRRVQAQLHHYHQPQHSAIHISSLTTIFVTPGWFVLTSPIPSVSVTKRKYSGTFSPATSASDSTASSNTQLKNCEL